MILKASQIFKKWYLVIFIFNLFLDFNIYSKSKEKESSYQIKVIRPRFMVKKLRFEIGLMSSSLITDTYSYTNFFGGGAFFHFSEYFGVEVLGNYGISHSRQDALRLENDFNVDLLDRFVPLMSFEVSFLITPLYGKYLSSLGDLIYFDSYFSIGGGMMRFPFDYAKSTCMAISQERLKTNPVVMYDFATAHISFHQRIFLTKYSSIKFGIKNKFYYRHINIQDICNIDNKNQPTAPVANEKDMTIIEKIEMFTAKLNSIVNIEFGISFYF